jgi:hypothetical protein
MVLTANKDSPKSQTGFAAGSLEFSDHSYFCGGAGFQTALSPLCANRAAGSGYPDFVHNVVVATSARAVKRGVYAPRTGLAVALRTPLGTSARACE